MSTLPTGSGRLTLTQWLIVSLAAIGFAFDIYELLMMQFIIKDLIVELTGFKPGSDGFRFWGSLLFYVPALAGGIFGLLGGYLTDRLGRRRVLTWSILIYAFSAFAAGFSTSIGMLLVLRCTTFVGVCVEFVAAVAWLAELFPEPRRRENVLGYTQAFSSLGGFLVAGAYWLAARYAGSLPTIQMPGFLDFLGERCKTATPLWRYTLMSGLIPALPLIVIRPFLPESPIWARKRAAGQLRRPSFGELFSPELRRTTVATTIVFACAYGAAFGAIQQIRQIVPGVPDVKEAIADMPMPQQKQHEAETSAFVGEMQELGGLTGRILLAILAVRIISRRLAAAGVSVAGADRCAARLCAGTEPGFDGADDRRLRGRVVHRRTVQLLGQLSAARLSGALAGHGRRLCREHRRADDRHVVRRGDAAVEQVHAGVYAADADCQRRRDGRLVRVPRG